MPKFDRRSLLALIGFAPAVAMPISAKPPRAPVRILFTRVNGEPYYAAAESLPTLAEGDTVTLRREPTNAHDRRAIEVFAARVARIAPGPDIRLIVDWLPG